MYSIEYPNNILPVTQYFTNLHHISMTKLGGGTQEESVDSSNWWTKEPGSHIVSLTLTLTLTLAVHQSVEGQGFGSLQGGVGEKVRGVVKEEAHHRGAGRGG